MASHGRQARGRDPIGPATPSELVERARSGDLHAFEVIIRSRMDSTYRLTLAVLGNEADAADAAQDTFVAAWRQLHQLRDLGRFDAWLTRIAVNATRMTLRARGRRRVREIPSGEVGAMAGRAVEPSDRKLLDGALRRLPIEQRTLLALHYAEDRPLAEIAAILEAPVGTVKSRLFAARRALDRALAQEADR